MLDSRAVLLLRIWMLLKEPLDFAQDFIKSVNDAIKLENPGKSLSRTQCYWLSFCITAIILTNSVCWIRFEKISLGRFKASSLSWMFRRGKLIGKKMNNTNLPVNRVIFSQNQTKTVSLKLNLCWIYHFHLYSRKINHKSVLTGHTISSPLHRAQRGGGINDKGR